MLFGRHLFGITKVNGPQIRFEHISARPAAAVPPASWPTRLALPLVLSLTYFLYAPATRFQFVYDDVFQIVQNDHLDSWRFLPVYFTQHVWSHIPEIPANFYRPLFLVWLRLNNEIFNHEPTGWHLTTILLHLAVTGLTFHLARQLLRQRTAAVIAALIFGIHPIHIEAVGWISGVPEPLSGVFFLGSLLCYLQARLSSSGRTWRAASLLLFGAALLSKETAAVLPLVILAFELTLGGRESSTQGLNRQVSSQIRRLMPYFCVLAAYLIVRTWVLTEMTHRMTQVPLSTSLMLWPWLICIYLRQLFWPTGLSPLYNPAQVNHPGQAQLLLPVLILICVGLALWAGRRIQSGLPIFLGLWFLITLAPALLVFCVALPAEGYHDRYLYLPSIAFAIGMGAVFSWMANGSGARKALALTLLISAVGAMAVSTYRQLEYWQNNRTLFEHAASVAPQNEIANLNFSSELVKTREYARASRFAERAVQDNPSSAPALASAGAAAFFLKDYQQAASYYENAIQKGTPQADWYYTVGLCRLRLNQFEAARDTLQQSVAMNPKARGVHYALAVAESHLDQWQDATNNFALELSLDSSNQAARSGLVDAERHLHQPVSGITARKTMRTRQD